MVKEFLGVKSIFLKVMDKRERVILLLRKYTGATAELLLKNALKKNNIVSIDKCSKIELVNFENYISDNILSPLLSKGRLALACAELNAALKLNPNIKKISLYVGNVRVVSNDIYEKNELNLIKISDYILKEEMKRYGIKNFEDTESETRIKVLEGFITEIFGVLGKSILREKIIEYEINDLCKAPQYRKIQLMEYIIQSMLMYYVNPAKGKILRSELVSILDIDLKLMQTGKNMKVDEITVENVRVSEEPENKEKKYIQNYLIVEDKIEYIIKTQKQTKMIKNIQNAGNTVKNDIIIEITRGVLGQVTNPILDNMLIKDPQTQTKYLKQLMKDFLIETMPPKSRDRILDRISF